ncbi:FAD-dependent oxidoreductase [Streptomyces antnestii]|uniref:FAD-dependent oxidoreductase n=1 Tax=Streptomyces antnestii TaxID=2494256 RepID=A0A437PN08_9ACTN|nr:NAD(P)/FAD-dependent oxidoreductase [Streptomyces sp. San01]RVU23671.1 FAD-dependent oxidoreductase [Streptomyces sp. San01]
MADTDVDVAVVGAGISGLATAFHLAETGRSVRVYEACTRVGGRMAGRRHEGFVLDEGAESIAVRGYDNTWQLIRAVGLAEDAVVPVGGRIALWRDGRAHANFGHPAGLLTGAGMSWRGRLSWLRFTAALMRHRNGFDQDRPEATPLGDATIAEYAHRYHRDVYDCLLQPMAGGFFGWQPERSAIGPMAALLLAVGGAGARWVTYRNGMDTLTRALADRLDVVTGNAVVAVKPGPRTVSLDLADGKTVTAGRAVLAVPAPVALTLHADVPDDERPYLAASTYRPMLKVLCLLDRPLPSPTRRPSYALHVRAADDQVCAGVVLDHIRAPDRVPSGRGLLSLFVSPYASARLLERTDDEIVSEVSAHAERYLPGLTEATRTAIVVRWPNGLPEATPDALRLRRAFLERPLRRVDYAGDWVALRPNSEAAVHSATLAARRVLAAGTS